MSGFHASSATEDEVDQYRHGECHIFALALLRRFGWRIRLAVDLDEHYWEDETDPDNFIPTVAHAYAVDGEGNAWDIAGVRPVAEIAEDMNEWVAIQDLGIEECCSEDGLRDYVGCWSDGDGDEPIDRPLASYEEADVAEADAVAMRVLAGLPGFPAAAVPGI